ncbi:MAG: hypothetical protein IJ849_06115 [Selenomonadaceae bacterium]|nr:hypothetical protein [Selenomonadaceae bacterium]
MNPIVAWPNTGTDTSVFRTVGLAIQQGGMPYVDSFDHKGPLLYLFYWLGMNISYNHGVWLLCFISLFGTCFAMYRIARLRLNRYYACLTTAVATIPALRKYYEEGGGLTEDFAMPFIAISLYFFLSYFHGHKISTAQWAVIGVSFMAVAMLRVNMVVPFVFFPVIILASDIISSSVKAIIKPLMSFLLGFIIPGIFILAWLYSGDALTACFADYIEFNIAYSSDPTRASLYNKLKTFYFFAKSPWMLVAMGILIYKCLCKAVTERLFLYKIYILYILLVLVSICISGQQYGHYGMVLVPALAFPCAVIIPSVISSIKSEYIKYMGITLFVGLSLLALFPVAIQAKSLYLNGYTNLDVLADEELHGAITEIQKRTNEEDFISVYGNRDVFYVATPRKSASVYSYQFPIAMVDERIGEAYFSDLQKRQPKIIVIQQATLKTSTKLDEMLADYLTDNNYAECYRNPSYILYEKSKP